MITLLIIIGCIIIIGAVILAWSLAKAANEDDMPGPFDD